MLPRLPPLNRFAVVVGIDSYRNGIPPLKNAVRDARAIGDALEPHGFSEKDGTLVSLFDRDASYDALYDALTERLPALGVNHDVLVYFAGHGHAALDDAGGLRGYLLPSDADAKAPDGFLGMDVLRAAFGKMKCRHLLVVLDCCFAGVFAQAPIHRDFGRRPLIRARYDGYLRRRAYQLIASAAHDEKAIDSFQRKVAQDQLGGEHSPFARAMLDALGSPSGADQDNDGVICTTDLYLLARSRLDEISTAHFEQTPSLWPLDWHDGGEFMFHVGEPQLYEPPPLTPADNPYRGLEPFRATDSELFFGRASLAEALAARALTAPLTVVLGHSGAGKTSILQAGVLQRLSQAMVCGPIRPQGTPLHNLSRALAAHGLLANAGSSDADPAESPPGLGVPVIVIIDPLDELITSCPGPERTAFLALFHLLLRVRANPAGAADLSVMVPEGLSSDLKTTLSSLARCLLALGSRLHLVVSVRSDYEPHFSDRFAATSADWVSSRFIIPLMNREEMREAIERPAAARHFLFSSDREGDGPPLVDALLDEVEQMPGGLPLLSVAMSEMFVAYASSGRDDRTVGWHEYAAIGGASGALRRRAEQVYAFVDGQQAVWSQETRQRHQSTLRELMLRMVSLEGGAIARRRVAKRELAFADENETARMKTVLDSLVAARLVVVEAGAPGDTAADDDSWLHGVAEPAHDALVRGWPRLLEWVEADHAKLLFSARLAEAAFEWKHSSDQQLRRAVLWDDDRLGELRSLGPQESVATRASTSWLSRITIGFVDWIRVKGTLSRLAVGSVNQSERAFLEASLRARRRRLFALVGAVAVVFVGLSVLALAWRGQRETARAAAAAEKLAASDARAQTRVATARALALTASTLAAGDDPKNLVPALLIGVESIKLHPTPQADAVVRSALALLESPEEGGRDAAVTKDGKILVVLADGSVRQRGNERSLPFGLATAIGISDDSRLALANTDGKVRIFEAALDRSSHELQSFSVSGTVDRLTMSARGGFAVTLASTAARLWDVSTGLEVTFFVGPSPPRALLVSPDDQWLAVVEGPMTAPTEEAAARLVELRHGDRARLWNLRTKREVALPEPAFGRRAAKLLPPVAFSSDGALFAAPTQETQLGVWTLGQTPRIRRKISSTRMFSDVSSVALVGSEAGEARVAFGTAYGDVEVWKVVQAGEGVDNGLADRVFAWKATSFASFWEPVEAIAADATGSTIAASFREGATRIWDVDAGRELGRVPTDNAPVSRVRVLDRNHVVVWQSLGTRIWSITKCDEALSVSGPQMGGGVAFDNSRGLWALATADGITVVPPLALSPTFHLNGEATPLAFSTDGRLVVRRDQRIERWDLRKTPPAAELLDSPELASGIAEVAVDPSGDRLALLLQTHDVVLVDLSMWTVGPALHVEVDAGVPIAKRHVAGPTHFFPERVAISGQKLVVGFGNGGVTLFSTAGTGPVALAESPRVGGFSNVGVSYLALSRDARHLATLTYDGMLHLWDLTAPVPRHEFSVRTAGEPSAAVFDAGGNRLAVLELAGKDAKGGDLFRTRILDVSTSAAEALFTFPIRREKFSSVAFSNDGHWLGVSGGGASMLFPLTPEDLIAAACRRSGRDLTDTEWQSFVRDGIRRRCSEALPQK